MQVAINQQTEREICFEISLQIRVINNKHVVQFGESAAAGAVAGGVGGWEGSNISWLFAPALGQSALRHSHRHVQHVLSFGRACYCSTAAGCVLFCFVVTPAGAHLAGL